MMRRPRWCSIASPLASATTGAALRVDGGRYQERVLGQTGRGRADGRERHLQRCARRNESSDRVYIPIVHIAFTQREGRLLYATIINRYTRCIVGYCTVSIWAEKVVA